MLATQFMQKCIRQLLNYEVLPFSFLFDLLSPHHPTSSCPHEELVSYDLTMNKSTPTCQGNGLVLGLVTVMLCFDLQIVIPDIACYCNAFQVTSSCPALFAMDGDAV